jgi:hypothetical protein
MRGVTEGQAGLGEGAVEDLPRGIELAASSPRSSCFPSVRRSRRTAAAGDVSVIGKSRMAMA